MVLKTSVLAALMTSMSWAIQDLVDLLMEDHNERAARKRLGDDAAVAVASVDPGRNGEWRLAEGREAWRLLHDEVQHKLLQQVERGHSTCLRSLPSMLSAGNPLGEIFLLDVFVSCKQRALLFAVDLLGASFLSCLFYQASDSVKGKKRLSAEACGGEGEAWDFGEKLGRFVVVAVASVLFAEVPVLALESLQTKGLKWIEGTPEERCRKRRRQLRAWQVQEALFWTLGTTYCAFFVALFLANVSNSDSEDWFAAGCLALLEDLVAIPVCMALLIALLTKLLLLAYTRLARISAQQVARMACEHLHKKTNLMLPIVQA